MGCGMEWISGFKRGEDGRLCIEAQNAEGVRTATAVEDFKGRLQSEAESTRAATFELREGSVFPTERYLVAIGAAGLDSRSQRTWAFSSEDLTVVIPAQVMVFETVATYAPLKRLILSPSSPRRMVTVFAEDGALIEKPVNTQNRTQMAPTHERRMSWAQQYPSAAVFWSSVYTSALTGRLTPRLPKGKARIYARGALDGRMFYVSRMLKCRFIPGEAPFEFARGCACEFLDT